MSQLYSVEHGRPTIMWSALTISQMIDVLSDLAEYYQMVLAATNPHSNLFTTNLKTNLRSIKHRQYMVDDPDIVRLASAPSNAANWKSIKKCSKAAIVKLEAYFQKSVPDQEAEFNLRGKTLEMTLLGKLRSVLLPNHTPPLSKCAM